MDAISIRDRMIDSELRQREMARASRYHYREPALRQTVRAFGRVLVRIGQGLIAGGRRLEHYQALQAGTSVPRGQAG